MTARTRATAMTAAAKIAAAVVAAAKTAVVAAAAKTAAAAAAKATQKTQAPTPKSTKVMQVARLQRHQRQRWCTAPTAWITSNRHG